MQIVLHKVKYNIYWNIYNSKKARLRSTGLELLVKDLAARYGAEYCNDILIRDRR